MALVVFRTAVVYFLIIFTMRLMGKKHLGELQPSELVSTILISNLASLSIESPDLPLLASLVPLFVIAALEILLSALCLRSRTAQRLLSGTPRVIIRRGTPDQAQLRDLRLTADDLLEALRSKDIFELSDVELAIVETNGTVSVKKAFAAETPANRDLGIAEPPGGQPSLPLVMNGQLVAENLRLCQVDEDWVRRQCRQMGWAVQDVFLLLCGGGKKLSLIPKERP